jgi:hypothetical protein
MKIIRPVKFEGSWVVKGFAVEFTDESGVIDRKLLAGITIEEILDKHDGRLDVVKTMKYKQYLVNKGLK